MTHSAELHAAVLATVGYADLFDFPLTSAEIHRFLIGKAASGDAVQQALDQLVTSGELHAQATLYMLPKREELVALRQQRSVRAEQLWQSAERFAKWMSRLPFVRMIAVTGSLAANNPKSDADIDFLVVTSNDRLWLCRLFVLLVVRWAARSGIELCPNYLLTERSLALAEYDHYTGRELTQMRPLYGKRVYCEMMRLNPWVSDFLPNSGVGWFGPLPLDNQHFRPKRWFETLLSGRVGKMLEQWEQSRKMIPFAAATAHISEAQFTPDRCKGHITAHGQTTNTRFQQQQRR